MIIKSMSVKTEKNKLTSLPIEEQEAIEEFKNRLVKILGDNLVLLKLYGSKARGDWHKDSDIDLLAVLKHEPKASDWRNDPISELEYQIMEKYNFKVFPSTITYKYKEYQKDSRVKTPFLYWVNKEGIDLWNS